MTQQKLEPTSQRGQGMVEPIAPIAGQILPVRPRRARAWIGTHPFAAFVLFLITIVILLRLTWGAYTTRLVAGKLDQIRRAGQPATIADLSFAPLPDAENAWTAYMRATAAIKPGVDSPRASVLEYPSYPPYGHAWQKLAEASETGNAAVFPLARTARSLPHAQLRQGITNFNAVFSVRYNDARNLANTLADGATYAHLQGDSSEAVERLLDVLHLARSLRQDPLLISQLVGIGIDALALDATQQITPTLAIGPAGGNNGGSASPDQVGKLIAVLLDENKAQTWFAESLLVERALVFDQLTQQSADTWAIRPLAGQTTLRWLAGFETLIEAANAPNHTAARRVLSRLSRTWEPSRFANLFGAPQGPVIPRYSRWFEDGGPSALARSIDQYYRVSAERRATAVAVAARMYRRDNNHWPADLNALVPAYLSAIPLDPFLEDGRPLGYVLQRGVLPDGGDRPLVYFDAGDATDAVIDTEPMYGWQNDRRQGRREANRQYRDLTLWLPTTRRFDEYQKQLGTQAVDKDPDEADAPWDDEQHDGDADNPAEQ